MKLFLPVLILISTFVSLNCISISLSLIAPPKLALNNLFKFNRTKQGKYSNAQSTPGSQKPSTQSKPFPIIEHFINKFKLPDFNLWKNKDVTPSPTDPNYINNIYANALGPDYGTKVLPPFAMHPDHNPSQIPSVPHNNVFTPVQSYGPPTNTHNIFPPSIPNFNGGNGQTFIDHNGNNIINSGFGNGQSSIGNNAQTFIDHNGNTIINSGFGNGQNFNGNNGQTFIDHNNNGIINSGFDSGQNINGNNGQTFTDQNGNIIIDSGFSNGQITNGNNGQTFTDNNGNIIINSLFGNDQSTNGNNGQTFTDQNGNIIINSGFSNGQITNGHNGQTFTDHNGNTIINSVFGNEQSTNGNNGQSFTDQNGNAIIDSGFSNGQITNGNNGQNFIDHNGNTIINSGFGNGQITNGNNGQTFTDQNGNIIINSGFSNGQITNGHNGQTFTDNNGNTIINSGFGNGQITNGNNGQTFTDQNGNTIIDSGFSNGLNTNGNNGQNFIDHNGNTIINSDHNGNNFISDFVNHQNIGGNSFKNGQTFNDQNKNIIHSGFSNGQNGFDASFNDNQSFNNNQNAGNIHNGDQNILNSLGNTLTNRFGEGRHMTNNNKNLLNNGFSFPNNQNNGIIIPQGNPANFIPPNNLNSNQYIPPSFPNVPGGISTSRPGVFLPPFFPPSVNTTINFPTNVSTGNGFGMTLFNSSCKCGQNFTISTTYPCNNRTIPCALPPVVNGSTTTTNITTATTETPRSTTSIDNNVVTTATPRNTNLPDANSTTAKPTVTPPSRNITTDKPIVAPSSNNVTTNTPNGMTSSNANSTTTDSPRNEKDIEAYKSKWDKPEIIIKNFPGFIETINTVTIGPPIPVTPIIIPPPNLSPDYTLLGNRFPSWRSANITSFEEEEQDEINPIWVRKQKEAKEKGKDLSGSESVSFILQEMSNAMQNDESSAGVIRPSSNKAFETFIDYKRTLERQKRSISDQDDETDAETNVRDKRNPLVIITKNKNPPLTAPPTINNDMKAINELMDYYDQQKHYLEAQSDSLPSLSFNSDSSNVNQVLDSHLDDVSLLSLINDNHKKLIEDKKMLQTLKTKSEKIADNISHLTAFDAKALNPNHRKDASSIDPSYMEETKLLNYIKQQRQNIRKATNDLMQQQNVVNSMSSFGSQTPEILITESKGFIPNNKMTDTQFSAKLTNLKNHPLVENELKLTPSVHSFNLVKNLNGKMTPISLDHKEPVSQILHSSNRFNIDKDLPASPSEQHYDITDRKDNLKSLFLSDDFDSIRTIQTQKSPTKNNTGDEYQPQQSFSTQSSSVNSKIPIQNDFFVLYPPVVSDTPVAPNNPVFNNRFMNQQEFAGMQEKIFYQPQSSQHVMRAALPNQYSMHIPKSYERTPSPMRKQPYIDSSKLFPYYQAQPHDHTQQFQYSQPTVSELQQSLLSMMQNLTNIMLDEQNKPQDSDTQESTLENLRFPTHSLLGFNSQMRQKLRQQSMYPDKISPTDLSQILDYIFKPKDLEPSFDDASLDYETIQSDMLELLLNIINDKENKTKNEINIDAPEKTSVPVAEVLEQLMSKVASSSVDSDHSSSSLIDTILSLNPSLKSKPKSQVLNTKKKNPNMSSQISSLQTNQILKLVLKAHLINPSSKGSLQRELLSKIIEKPLLDNLVGRVSNITKDDFQTKRQLDGESNVTSLNATQKSHGICHMCVNIFSGNDHLNLSTSAGILQNQPHVTYSPGSRNQYNKQSSKMNPKLSITQINYGDKQKVMTGEEGWMPSMPPWMENPPQSPPSTYANIPSVPRPNPRAMNYAQSNNHQPSMSTSGQSSNRNSQSLRLKGPLRSNPNGFVHFPTNKPFRSRTALISSSEKNNRVSSSHKNFEDLPLNEIHVPSLSGGFPFLQINH